MTKITHRDSATLRVPLDPDLSRSQAPDGTDDRPAKLQVDATFTSDQGAVFLHVQADARRVTLKFETPAQFKAFMNDRLAPEQLGIPGVAGNEGLLRLVQRSADVRDIDDFRWARDGMAFREEDREVRERAGIADTSVDARSVAEGAQGLVRQMQRFLIENGCLRPTRGSRRNDDGVLGAGTRHGWLAFFRQHPATYEAFLGTLGGSTRAWFPPVDELQSAGVAQIRAWARREVAFPIEQLTTLHQAMSQVGVDAFEKRAATSGNLETVTAGLGAGAAAGAATDDVSVGPEAAEVFARQPAAAHVRGRRGDRSGPARRGARVHGGSEAARAPAGAPRVATGTEGEVGEALKQLEKVVAFQKLVGGAELNGRGEIQIRDRKITRGELETSVNALFGDNVSLDANGALKLRDNRLIDANVAAQFRAAFEAAELDGEGRITFGRGKIDADVRAGVKAMFGPLTAIANNRVVFDDGKLQQIDVDDRLVATFGEGTSASAMLKSSITRDGIRDAEALAAFKTILGTTAIDSSGKLVLRNSRFDRATFETAVKTVLGDGAELEADGKVDLSRAGISAEVASQFRAVYDAAKIDAKGCISLDQSKLDADLQAAITAMFGPMTAITNNRIVFDDGLFQVAELDNKFVGKFGEHAKLDTALKGSITREGIKSAAALAAFKTLVGNTVLDARGRLVIKDNRITRAQMQAAIKTAFGDGATLDAQGKLNWRQRGIDAELAAHYKAVYEAATLDADGRVTFDQGRLGADLRLGIDVVFGRSAIVTNNRIVFDDGMFEHLDLEDRFTAKLGEGANLSTSLKGNVTREGLAHAEALAAFKALVGSTEIDSTGKLVVKDNRITNAQLEAALKATLGKNATLDARGQFDWTQKGISGSVAAKYKAIYDAAEIDAQGHIALPRSGQIDADLRAAVTAQFGPLTAVTNNRIVFDDGLFDKAELDNRFVGKFGEHAKLSTALKGTITRKGIEDAEALAAFKTLVGNTRLDTSGRLVIKDNEITRAQLEAATKTLFGKNSSLDAKGGVTWSREHGIRAEAAAQFKAVYEKATVDANGSLRFEDGSVDADLQAKVTAMFGKATSVATNGRLVFEDGMFRELGLESRMTTAFGEHGSLEVLGTATVTREGIAKANLFAAAKRVVGSLEVQANGDIRIVDNEIDEVSAALNLIAGKNVKVENGVVVDFDRTGNFSSAEFRNHFLMVLERSKVDTNGTIRFSREGGPEGELEAAVTHVFGDRADMQTTASGDAKISFDASGIKLEKLEAGVESTLGPVNLGANIEYDGKVNGTISLGAFKSLKALRDDGSIDVRTDGSITIKDNEIDRAEVSALVTAVARERVDITTDGKLVYANGKLGGELGTSLKTAFDNTEVTASGKLKIVDGELGMAGKLSAMFEGSSVSGRGTIEIEGVDKMQLGFALKSKGEGTKLDASGSLTIDEGRIRGASMSTSLVSTGDDTNNLALNGVLSVTDAKAAGKLQGQMQAGAFKGLAGISAESAVKPYVPAQTDVLRRRAMLNGGHWAERTFSFDASGSAGAEVQAGGVPIRVGFGVDGSTQTTIRALTLHPTAGDATRPAPMTVLHMPETVDQFRAMSPGEVISRYGQGTFGLNGSVGIGYGVGAAEVSVGGQVYHKMTGDVFLEVEALGGDRYAVRVRRGRQKLQGASVGVTVGINGDKIPEIPGIGALNEKVKPMVTKLAQASFKKSWDRIGANETVFDIEFDLANPNARAAFERATKLDLSEAQAMSSYTDSGVTMKSRIRTQVNAQIDSTQIRLPGLSYESVAEWVNRVQEAVTPNELHTTETELRYLKRDGLFPWSSTKTASNYFVHTMDVPRVQQALPGGAKGSSSGAFVVRTHEPPKGLQPILRDTNSFMKFSFTLEDACTSKSDMKERVPPLVGAMQYLGLLPDYLPDGSKEAREIGSYAEIDGLDQLIRSEIAPGKKALFIGLGDKRYRDTRLAFDAFISPRGVLEIFRRLRPKSELDALRATGERPESRVWRTRSEFIGTYLDAAAALGEVHPLSTQALTRAIEKTLDARLQVQRGPKGRRIGFTVIKDGAQIGTIQQHEIDALRGELLGRDLADDLTISGSQLGTWASAPPERLLHMEGLGREDFPGSRVLEMQSSGDEETRAAREIYRRAESFGDGMMKIEKLFEANVAPGRRSGESEEAYRARIAALGILPPETYYNKVEGILREIQEDQDWQLAAQLAMLSLGGPRRRAVRARIDLPEGVMRGMIETGRRNVQRFGGLLQLLGRTEIEGNRLVVTAPGAEQQAITTAVEMFAGKNIIVSRDGDELVYDNLNLGDDRRAQAFRDILRYAQRRDGHIVVPSRVGVAQVNAALDRLVGEGVAVYEQHRGILFDNRGYDRVNINHALREKFGGRVVGFQTLEEIPPQAGDQIWDEPWDFELNYTGPNFHRQDLEFLERHEVSDKLHGPSVAETHGPNWE